MSCQNIAPHQLYVYISIVLFLELFATIGIVSPFVYPPPISGAYVRRP